MLSYSQEPEVSSTVPIADRGKSQKTVTFFQVDTHTACAGEVKRMLSEHTTTSLSETRSRKNAGSSFAFRWIGYSLARNVCHNFDLCPRDVSLRDRLGSVFEAHRRGDLPITEARQWTEALLEDILAVEREMVVTRGRPEKLGVTVDFIVCTQPVNFCRYFLGKQGNISFLVYTGLPLLWMVPHEEREVWAAEEFPRLIQDSRNVVLASSLFIAETMKYQYGVILGSNIPFIPMLGLHALDKAVVPEKEGKQDDHHEQSDDKSVQETGKKTKILIGRSGMNGYLLECVLGSFIRDVLEEQWLDFQLLEDVLVEEREKLAKKNKNLPEVSHGGAEDISTVNRRAHAQADGQVLEAKGVQKEEKRIKLKQTENEMKSVSTATTTEPEEGSWVEVRIPSFPYARLREEFSAAVIFPYDAAIFLLHELYTLSVPLLVPRDVWRFMQGPLTHPDMEWRGNWVDDENERYRLNLGSTRHGDNSVDQEHSGEQHKSRLDRHTVTVSPFQSVKIELMRPLELERALSWMRYSNFFFLPHLFYWRSVADIAQFAITENLEEIRSEMRQWNLRHTKMVRAQWRSVASRISGIVNLGEA
ncbi:unnamed protein product [Amoebophrya sp. A25]|nr:unnamed protein product [Amoebophrya sp. A25]|eukprot:GSA25T00010998001.1